MEEEKRVYSEKMSVQRKVHLKEYWERQTQVENTYLERYQTERIAKQRRDLDKWRTAICNISMHTKRQMNDLKKKEQDLLHKMRVRDLNETKRAMDNRLMLDVMQVDSRKWPTLGDLNQKVDENVVLPQTILNYGEYQQKLQNLAFFAEQGDHESMQKLLDKEDVMEKKNVLLQPIFRDLKSAIRHMTYTDEFKIIKEYLDNRTTILQQYGNQPESESCKEGLKSLERQYSMLLRNQKQHIKSDPNRKLKVLQKRLEDMFQLLSLWTQYVEVIYMPESDIHILSAIERLDARPEDTAYGFRTQSNDVKSRINSLFSDKSEEAKSLDEDDFEKEQKEDYETVNEGLTTDTTEATGAAVRRGEKAEAGEALAAGSEKNAEN